MEARNELEGYAYSLKNQIGDKEKLGGKLSDEDKTTIEEAVDKVRASPAFPSRLCDWQFLPSRLCD